MGGNLSGLYEAVFGPNGNSILGHGYQGAFHLWRRRRKKIRRGAEKEFEGGVAEEQLGAEQWEPVETIGGHFGAVQDVVWDPRGRFFLSASADQTTRLHAPWRRKHTHTHDDSSAGTQEEEEEEEEEEGIVEQEQVCVCVSLCVCVCVRTCVCDI